MVAECIREDKGFRYIAEQVSHHPPISACHAESLSDKYCYWQGKFSSVVFFWSFCWSFGLFVGLFSRTKVFDDLFRFSTENSLLGPVYRNYESRWGARHHQQERALPVEQAQFAIGCGRTHVPKRASWDLRHDQDYLQQRLLCNFNFRQGKICATKKLPQKKNRDRITPNQMTIHFR